MMGQRRLIIRTENYGEKIRIMLGIFGREVKTDDLGREREKLADQIPEAGENRWDAVQKERVVLE